MSIRDIIKSALDVKKEIVKCPEWGVEIEVRTMTGRQRAILLRSSVDDKDQFMQEKFQTGIVIACCFDPETEEKIFQITDEEWLLEKSAGPVERLARKAMDLSGLTENALLETEKN